MQENLKPKVGMIFDSYKDAWNFWVDYSGRAGFGARKQWSHDRKDGSFGSCRFVCCKEGLRKADKRDNETVNSRPETRPNCPARIGLKNMGGKLLVHDFVEEHNHILHTKETAHMLPSQRKLSEIQCQQIDLADDAGLQQRKLFDLMNKEVGGRSNLGYTRIDQKNYLSKRRQRSLVHGKAGFLLQYFQRKMVENPAFYHAYQIDGEKQITNVFWADARMLIDYVYFGDMVSLDSTYCTNKSPRPLAVFPGFNHHRIFRVALLYDETAESYKWLFETFLEAHKQKMPQTVFIDQDQAMAKALLQVMPGSYHGLCTWHLMQNGIKHLVNLMKGGSYFLTDINKCMYGYEDEEKFEDGWRPLLLNYDVIENTWLQRAYTLKEKWASCYMRKAYTLGMRSTQLSESVNTDIKSFMSVDLDIVKFFKRFEDVVEEKRYNELRCEYEAWQKLPKLKNPYSSILQQMAEHYTPTIFDLFQREHILFEACCVKSMNIQTSSIVFVIAMVRDLDEWRVSFDPQKNTICCSCRKFESCGILCCRCIRVFIHMDVKVVPKQYILKRLTKLARSGSLPNVGVNHVVQDVDMSPTQHYKEICPRLIRIATEASRSQETFMFLSKVTDELDRQILEFQTKEVSNVQVDVFHNKVKEITSKNGDSTQVKGFKKKEGTKGSKRKKGWVEHQLTKRNKNGSASSSQSQEHIVNNEVPNTSIPTWLNDAYSQPSMEINNTLSQIGVTSFTSLLMAQDDEDLTTSTNL